MFFKTVKSKDTVNRHNTIFTSSISKLWSILDVFISTYLQNICHHSFLLWIRYYSFDNNFRGFVGTGKRITYFQLALHTEIDKTTKSKVHEAASLQLSTKIDTH